MSKYTDIKDVEAIRTQARHLGAVNTIMPSMLLQDCASMLMQFADMVEDAKTESLVPYLFVENNGYTVTQSLMFSTANDVALQLEMLVERAGDETIEVFKLRPGIRVELGSQYVYPAGAHPFQHHQTKQAGKGARQTEKST